MSNILITGGAGFVGTNLASRLTREGHDVIVLDCLQTSGIENTIGHGENYHFILHDIRKPLPDVGKRFDYIYNLACPASPPQYQKASIFTMETCSFGTYNVLNFAREHGGRVLHASTSEIYGDPVISPQREEYWGNVNTVGPRACYDEGKRFAEALCYEYSHVHNVDVRIARIFNTYGPYMCPNDGRVISNFVCSALSNKRLTIYGDGSQSRSFCYVDDLVEGLIRLMTYEPTSKDLVVMNLGNPDEYSVKDIAHIVSGLTHTDSEFSYHPLPQDDPQKRRPDIDKARQQLGWEPKVSLQEGLQQTIAYFKRRLEID